MQGEKTCINSFNKTLRPALRQEYEVGFSFIFCRLKEKQHFT